MCDGVCTTWTHKLVLHYVSATTRRVGEFTSRDVINTDLAWHLDPLVVSCVGGEFRVWVVFCGGVTLHCLVRSVRGWLEGGGRVTGGGWGAHGRGGQHHRWQASLTHTYTHCYYGDWHSERGWGGRGVGTDSHLPGAPPPPPLPINMWYELPM